MGIDNIVADALSKNTSVEIMEIVLTPINSDLLKKILESWAQDQKL